MSLYFLHADIEPSTLSCMNACARCLHLLGAGNGTQSLRRLCVPCPSPDLEVDWWKWWGIQVGPACEPGPTGNLHGSLYPVKLCTIRSRDTWRFQVETFPVMASVQHVKAATEVSAEVVSSCPLPAFTVPNSCDRSLQCSPSGFNGGKAGSTAIFLLAPRARHTLSSHRLNIEHLVVLQQNLLVSSRPGCDRSPALACCSESINCDITSCGRMLARKTTSQCRPCCPPVSVLRAPVTRGRAPTRLITQTRRTTVVRAQDKDSGTCCSLSGTIVLQRLPPAVAILHVFSCCAIHEVVETLLSNDLANSTRPVSRSVATCPGTSLPYCWLMLRALSGGHVE